MRLMPFIHCLLLTAIIATALVGYQLSKFVRVEPSSVPFLIEDLKVRDDPLKRITAARRLKEVKARTQVSLPVSDELVTALSDPNCEVRTNAAQGLEIWLTQQWSDRAAPALIQTLRDKMPYVREAAARTLGTIGKERAGAAAIAALSALQSDEDPKVREVAISALRKLQNS